MFTVQIVEASITTTNKNVPLPKATVTTVTTQSLSTISSSTAKMKPVSPTKTTSTTKTYLTTNSTPRYKKPVPVVHDKTVSTMPSTEQRTSTTDSDSSDSDSTSSSLPSTQSSQASTYTTASQVLSTHQAKQTTESSFIADSTQNASDIPLLIPVTPNLTIASINTTSVTQPYTTGESEITDSLTSGISTTSTLCLPNMYHCPGGVQTLTHLRNFCIQSKEVCDGYTDCVSGADEADCGTTCSNGGFRCRDTGSYNRFLGGKCTGPNDKCDGIADCTDLSDENGCSCPTGHFRCLAGHDVYNGDPCIPQTYKCDRDADCSDGSDEISCTYNCPNGHVMCATSTLARWPYYGFCITQNERCDGFKVCLPYPMHLLIAI